MGPNFLCELTNVYSEGERNLFEKKLIILN